MKDKNNSNKKEKIINELKEEINQIKDDIQNETSKNSKISLLRNTKIGLCFLRLITPYVGSALILFYASSLANLTPFKRDMKKEYLNTMKEIDGLGNVKIVEQYNSFKNSSSSFSYFGRWEKQPDGFYTREVKEYSITKINEETLLSIIEGNKISSLDELLGEPIAEKIEKQNNLSETEINKPAHVLAITYTKDKTNPIVVTESVEDNVGTTLLWFFILILIELMPLFYRCEISSFDYKYAIERIKERYPMVDISDLELRLKIKEDNLKRLVR